VARHAQKTNRFDGLETIAQKRQAVAVSIGAG
jgi:hypothetical protein